MAYLGNTPTQATLLQVEARKSFSLGVHIKDYRGRAVNLTGCTLTIVAKPTPVDNESDDSNLLFDDATAFIPSPKAGYARFDIQASSLDQKAGEYPYAIVMRTNDGYSSVIVKGLLDIQPNTEYDSVAYGYSSANPPQTLNVLLRESNSVNVFVGGQLPPGMNYVRDDVMEAIENFDPDAIAMVPEGGVPGYVLTKTSAGDYSMSWLPVGQGAFALDATNQPAGNVPVSLGDDTWIWGAVGIDATSVPEGWAPLADGADGWSWGPVTLEIPNSNWDAAETDPGYIENKPALGTAALADVEQFVDAETIVSDMAGIHFQTSIPSTGEDGHLYFVYEA